MTLFCCKKHVEMRGGMGVIPPVCRGRIGAIWTGGWGIIPPKLLGS